VASVAIAAPAFFVGPTIFQKLAADVSFLDPASTIHSFIFTGILIVSITIVAQVALGRIFDIV